MNEKEQSAPDASILPPPLPVRERPATPWKKILLIVGLSLLSALAFTALIGALLFGGCMFLMQKLGH